jgi:hypothetical protein
VNSNELAEELTLTIVKEKLEKITDHCRKEIDDRPDLRYSCGSYDEGEYYGIKSAYGDMLDMLTELLDEL